MRKNTLFLLHTDNAFKLQLSGYHWNLKPAFSVITWNKPDREREMEDKKNTIMEKTYTWTYNIIKSCNNDFHFGCADALISLFEIKYGDTEMLFRLKELREYKWTSVHCILT